MEEKAGSGVRGQACVSAIPESAKRTTYLGEDGVNPAILRFFIECVLDTLGHSPQAALPDGTRYDAG